MTQIPHITKREQKLLHQGFEIMLVLKTLFALFEIACGIALIFLTVERLTDIISYDFFQNYIIKYHLASDIAESIIGSYTTELRHFYIIYLLSHGVTKLFVIMFLWLKKYWAYPLTEALLTLFILYQMYEYIFRAQAVSIIVFTVIDLIMIGLTEIERRMIRRI